MKPLSCPDLIGATLTGERIVIGSMHKSRSKRTKTLFKVLSVKDGSTENILSYLLEFENTEYNRALLTVALGKMARRENSCAKGPEVALVKGRRLHLYEIEQGEGLFPIVYWVLPKEGMNPVEALSWALHEEVSTDETLCICDNRVTASLKPFRN